jgi:hypothetical protein
VSGQRKIWKATNKAFNAGYLKRDKLEEVVETINFFNEKLERR